MRTVLFPCFNCCAQRCRTEGFLHIHPTIPASFQTNGAGLASRSVLGGLMLSFPGRPAPAGPLPGTSRRGGRYPALLRSAPRRLREPPRPGAPRGGSSPSSLGLNGLPCLEGNTQLKGHARYFSEHSLYVPPEIGVCV